MEVYCTGDSSFSHYLKHIQSLPRFKPLYRCIKYYLYQNQLTTTSLMNCLIPLSVVYILTVVATEEEKKYLGQLFLRYLQFFSSHDNLYSNSFSFYQFCRKIEEQCHISLDLNTIESSRLITV